MCCLLQLAWDNCFRADPVPEAPTRVGSGERNNRLLLFFNGAMVACDADF
jgi:hypothetical protein